MGDMRVLERLRVLTVWFAGVAGTLNRRRTALSSARGAITHSATMERARLAPRSMRARWFSLTSDAMIASVGRKKRGRKLRQHRKRLALADFETSRADALLSAFTLDLVSTCHTPGAFTQNLLDRLDRLKFTPTAAGLVIERVEPPPPKTPLRLIVDNE
jgi:hypothetical protein